jgi:nitronate monooxygenase
MALHSRGTLAAPVSAAGGMGSVGGIHPAKAERARAIALSFADLPPSTKRRPTAPVICQVQTYDDAEVAAAAGAVALLAQARRPAATPAP